MSFATNVA
jgi:hypothetical protein